MKILITGGAGFIGTNLAMKLVSAGHKVVVIDDLSTGLAKNISNKEIDLRIGSIVDKQFLFSQDFSDFSIVHLAARGSVPRSIADPLATHEVNVLGTLNVLELARLQKNHLVVVSSSSVYGNNPKIPKNEDDWTRPISPYGASKLAGEAYTFAYQNVFGIDAILFRLFNVYGPYQRADHEYSAVIPKFALSAIRGLKIDIFGDGNQYRDFTYVGDVVEVIKFAIENRVTYSGPINLAFGNPVSLLEIISLIEKKLEMKLELTFKPARKGDVKFSNNNPALLYRLFGNLDSTNIDTGIRNTVDWLRLGAQ